MTEPTLFDRVGGAETIDGLVDEFYRRVWSDPTLQPFFEHTEMDKLRRMQKEFFSLALDGPVPDDEIKLKAAHANRGIQREHLTRFTEHLLNTLKDVGVEEDSALSIVARIATYSGEILGDSYEFG